MATLRQVILYTGTDINLAITPVLHKQQLRFFQRLGLQSVCSMSRDGINKVLMAINSFRQHVQYAIASMYQRTGISTHLVYTCVASPAYPYKI